MNQKRILQIKERLEDMKTRRDQSLGVLSTLKKRLPEFGCQTLKEAKKKIKELESEVKELETNLENYLQEYEDRYGEQLR